MKEDRGSLKDRFPNPTVRTYCSAREKIEQPILPSTRISINMPEKTRYQVHKYIIAFDINTKQQKFTIIQSTYR